MSVTFSNSSSATPQAGGSNRTANVTVPVNTKSLYVFIYSDASNTVANTLPPTVYTLDGLDLTYVTSTPSAEAAPYGLIQYVYKYDNPTPGTRVLSITTPQYFFVGWTCVVADNPLIATIGAFQFGTSLNPACSVSSSNGNKTLFSVVANDTDSVAGIVDDSGTLTKLRNDGGVSRCGFVISSRTSSGTTNSASWTISLSKTWSAIAINFSDDVNVVNSITDPAHPGDTITYSTTGFPSINGITTDVVGGTISALADTGGDGTAVIGNWVEGSLYDILPKTINYALTDGNATAYKAATLAIPVGFTKVPISMPLTNIPTTIGGAILVNTGRAIKTGDILYHTTYSDLVVYANSDYLVTGAGTITVWLRVGSGVDVGKMYRYDINITTSTGSITVVDFSLCTKQTESPIFDGGYFNTDRP